MIKWMLRFLKLGILASACVSWLAVAYMLETLFNSFILALLFSLVSIFSHSLALSAIDALSLQLKENN